MARKQNLPDPFDSGHPYQRDGNNVSKIADDPKPLLVERPHTEWKGEDGECKEKPDWASDRDRD